MRRVQTQNTQGRRALSDINRVNLSGMSGKEARGFMEKTVRQWVESGRFEKQTINIYDRLEKPIKAFLWFAAGYFTFAVQRMLQ